MENELVKKEIVLKPRDLTIRKITLDGNEREVVQLKTSVAFDEDFIEECRALGVKSFVERDDKGEDISD